MKPCNLFSRVLPNPSQIAAIALTLSPAIAAAQRAEVPSRTLDFEHLALGRAAVRVGGTSGDFEIASSTTARFPHTGREARVFKVIDSEGGVIGIAFDEQGNEVDPEVLAAREARARFQRFGRMDEALFATRAAADSGDRIAVVIWLTEAESDGLEVPAPDSLVQLLPDHIAQDAFAAEIDRVRASAVRELTLPILARLDAAGVQATADEFAPMLQATVTPAELDEIASWTEVDRVFGAQVFESAQGCTFSQVGIWPVHNQGLVGTGERIAQVEVGGRVASNPFLFGVTQDSTSVCTYDNAHATAVAGLMAAAAPGIGVAFGAQLYATGTCGGYENELTASSNRAMSWGARAINLSIQNTIDSNRVLSSLDRFYDNMVQARRRTIVVAAGNRGAIDGDVTNPALAYNVISVGNYDVGPDCLWVGDESMNPTSSYGDPVSSNGDREKPELAAPGTLMFTTTTATPFLGDHYSGSGIEVSGTSFSAPVVTGVTALLMQRNNALRFWPESVKAILMASALGNIEGAARLSEKDGAGSVDATWADQLAQRSYGNWNGQAYNCSYPLDYTFASFTLAAGERLRAVIAWDTTTSYSDYFNRPSADLDLGLFNSAGTQVANSSSWDNTYEIIDFTAPANGTFSLRVHKYRCDVAPRYLGWAYLILPYIG